MVAFDCFLRARQELLRWTPDGLNQALRLVDEALALVGDNPFLAGLRGDPEFRAVMAELNGRWEAVVEWEAARG